MSTTKDKKKKKKKKEKIVVDEKAAKRHKSELKNDLIFQGMIITQRSRCVRDLIYTLVLPYTVHKETFLT